MLLILEIVTQQSQQMAEEVLQQQKTRRKMRIQSVEDLLLTKKTISVEKLHQQRMIQLLDVASLLQINKGLVVDHLPHHQITQILDETTPLPKKTTIEENQIGLIVGVVGKLITKLVTNNNLWKNKRPETSKVSVSEATVW